MDEPAKLGIHTQIDAAIGLARPLGRAAQDDASIVVGPIGFLAGGGEMGARMRSHDWASTSLGPPETWPQSLRTAVSICLNSPILGTVLWGPDLLMLYNDAYIPSMADRHPGAMGRSVKEVWGSAWDQVAPPFYKALTTGEGFSETMVELPMVRRGKPETTYWDFSAAPIRGEDGGIAGLFNQGVEITEQVLTRRQVLGERERFAELFEQAPTFMAMLRGPDHRIEMANPGYRRLIGNRDVIGRTVAEALPDAVAQGYLELLDSVYRSGKPFAANGARYGVQVSHGGPIDERHVDFVFQPIVDAVGKVSGIFVEGVDVTARTLADAALRDSEARLRELNETLEQRGAERETALRDTADFARLALSSVGSVGVWTYEAASDRFFCDAAICELYGLDTGKGLSGFARADFLANVFPEDRPRLKLKMAEGLKRSGELELEYRISHPDGSTRWVLSRGYTYHDEAGMPLRRTGIGIDMTKQRQLEEQLRQSQKMEAVGQLTGGVAHDFNNLLTVIRSSIDLLKRPGLADERRQRYIEAISDTTTRAAKLTGQLLAFARRQALKPEVFDVAESVRAISDMVGTLTGSRIQIETQGPDGPCYVHADASQFDTSLVNLAVNARDAMDGEGTLTVTVGTATGIPALRAHPEIMGDFVTIAVSDTGSGIAPDNLERIFEPFFTTKGVGEGTGLGLSQVFGFVKQSGGEVEVLSLQGQGTTFRLYLPRVAGLAAAVAAPPDQHTVDGYGTCVLLVEDNVDVGSFATITLDELGYRSVLADDAAAALAELAKDAARFDVVFSDVIMPGMSGIELAQDIRRRHPDLPVVLTSGYSHVLAQSGSDGFELLHKPYSIEQLSRVLQKAAQWRRLRRLLDG